jgi:SAM-dependent methyltransferase
MGNTIAFYKEYLDYFGTQVEVLDLGGGRGLLTKALLDSGYKARGCDASSELVHIGHSYLDIPEDIYTNEDIASFVDSNKFRLEQQVGVIFLWHVIEHLDQPITLLKSLKPLLRPDGVIIAQGPLLDKSYIFPEHRFLHSESNIGWISQALDMKLLFLDSHSEERFASFVLANPDNPHRGLDVFSVSDVHDAIGSLFSNLSNALHSTRFQ